MAAREPTRLPFYERPDLSPFLVHLTKNTEKEDGYTAFQNLVNILRTGKIWGSEKKKGFIKGPHNATCFMDVPLTSLKYVLNKSNTDQDYPRYEPYGVVVTKAYAYSKGARPVLYLSDSELQAMNIPKERLWQVVRFEGVGENSIGWLHEREWRAKGDFPLPTEPLAVLVENSGEAKRLDSILHRNPAKYARLPKSIIPLTILCQGLPYMG
jgi:hypothetical protein